MPSKDARIHISLNPREKQLLESLAIKFGYTRGAAPNISELIGEIARGDRITIQWADSRPGDDPKKKAIQHAIALVQDGLSRLLRII